ncbi:hypothetical protein Acr_02g0007750 [Actinidia rufa]|uniref:Uncharacterized protein n=1 Tax=Actinidia rufa TaxID=165716 RepID=A0A7J0E838_9ERIC|nr:hypothetical protein Acr_02g0007750 [Actinidia rufa]
MRWPSSRLHKNPAYTRKLSAGLHLYHEANNYGMFSRCQISPLNLRYLRDISPCLAVRGSRRDPLTRVYSVYIKDAPPSLCSTIGYAQYTIHLLHIDSSACRLNFAEVQYRGRRAILTVALLAPRFLPQPPPSTMPPPLPPTRPHFVASQARRPNDPSSSLLQHPTIFSSHSLGHHCYYNFPLWQPSPSPTYSTPPTFF